MLCDHRVKLFLGWRLDFFAAIGAVMALDIGHQLPQRDIFSDARRPPKRGTDRDYFGASEASVSVEEPVCVASAGSAFPASL